MYYYCCLHNFSLDNFVENPMLVTQLRTKISSFFPGTLRKELMLMSAWVKLLHCMMKLYNWKITHWQLSGCTHCSYIMELVRSSKTLHRQNNDSKSCFVAGFLHCRKDNSEDKTKCRPALHSKFLHLADDPF